jgi:heme-degrading monooxygenase HmoA
MAGFAARLDAVNALAESSPGFVWRLKTEAGNATSISAHDDELILVNLSVWESVEHLKQFVYRSAHAEAMKSRRQWFERMREPHAALWWVAPGHAPTVAEAKERLAYLRLYGETEFAFSFARVIHPPCTVRTIEQLEQLDQSEQPNQTEHTTNISGTAA